jgi:hypothetical protein
MGIPKEKSSTNWKLHIQNSYLSHCYLITFFLFIFLLCLISPWIGCKDVVYLCRTSLGSRPVIMSLHSLLYRPTKTKSDCMHSFTTWLAFTAWCTINLKILLKLVNEFEHNLALMRPLFFSFWKHNYWSKQSIILLASERREKTSGKYIDCFSSSKIYSLGQIIVLFANELRA